MSLKPTEERAPFHQDVNEKKIEGLAPPKDKEEVLKNHEDLEIIRDTTVKKTSEGLDQENNEFRERTQKEITKEKEPTKQNSQQLTLGARCAGFNKFKQQGMGSVLVSGKPLKRADERIANYTLQGFHLSQPHKFTHQHIKLENYDGEAASDLDPYIDTTQYLELERTDALGKFSGGNLVNGKPNKADENLKEDLARDVTDPYKNTFIVSGRSGMNSGAFQGGYDRLNKLRSVNKQVSGEKQPLFVFDMAEDSLLETQDDHMDPDLLADIYEEKRKKHNIDGLGIIKNKEKRTDIVAEPRFASSSGGGEDFKDLSNQTGVFNF